MTDKEYLEIILKGWCEDTGNNLGNHIYREWKKAEENHYSLEEFFRGLVRQQKGFTSYIDNKKFKRENEVAIIKSIWESEGKDIKELEGQGNISYSINLWHLTGDNKYLGFTLWQADIDYIGGQIANSFERAIGEKKAANKQQTNGTVKQWYHIDYIKRAINDLFTEQAERRLDNKGDNLLPSVEYIEIPFDTRNPEKLNEIVSNRLSEYLKEHPDNTKEIFIENQIEKAKEYQTYFPKYKIDKEHKEYYFKLQRWIDFLNELSVAAGTGKNSSPKKYNSLKEIFMSEAAYIECMNALRNVRNPVISQNNTYLLGVRQKGVFSAWYELIKQRQKIKPETISRVATQLLNKEIKGLNLCSDGSTLRKTGSSSYKLYRVPLTKLIT